MSNQVWTWVLGLQIKAADQGGRSRLQIKAAAELAKALGRQLVMPQLWCGVENLWGTHRGRFWGGVQYDLPSPCIMSQLFYVGE